jgi:pyruvate,water dikinase
MESTETAAAGIRDLHGIGKEDAPFAGSKGAKLGELSKAGLLVPAGFVVGAPIYRAFLGVSGLQDEITARLHGLDANDSVARDNTSVHIRAEINAAEVPVHIEDSIIAAYRQIGSAVVAVRASTTSENTASASFAGTNETDLSIRDETSLIRSVKHCWSSLFTSRNIYYAAKHGQLASSNAMAVIVQRQVDAEKAGMMITVDPVSGMDDRIIIEATFGFGEAVAGGSVLPDRYVVEKASRALLTKQIHHKEFVVEKEPGDGQKIRRLEGEGQDSSVLNDLEIQLLVDHALKAEQHFESPQSLEWAIDPDDVTWMLQVRPAPSVVRNETDQATVAPGIPGTLRGESAAPGVVTGRARVIDSTEDAYDFESDEILVARAIAPAWTPILQRASAVVTDLGGMTSHGATVARELQIPCVVGTGDATRRVRTGDRVMVDATNGIVVPE